MNHLLKMTAVLLLLSPGWLRAQESPPDGTLSLEQCILYGLRHQPGLKQSKLDQEIARKDISIRLSDWMPQVSVDANLQNNLKRTTNVLQIGDQEPQTLVFGTEYNSTVGLAVNQVIFNNDVLTAGRTASDYRERAAQDVTATEIDLVVNISKAYYQLLTTHQQIGVLDQTIQRLEKNLSDAKNRYDEGISDKIDFKRAQISLNNTNVQRKAAEGRYESQKVYLKQLMGLPEGEPLIVEDNVHSLESEALLDTTASLNYTDRIEYQQLETEKRLSDATIGYYKQDFIPSLSAFYNYNWAYLNNNFDELYQQSFPNSVVGLSVSLPVFQGLRRIRQIQKSRLQYQQLEYAEDDLTAQIRTEYTEAMNSYLANLKLLQASRENYEIADDVYSTVKLQYDEGIKAYIEVIVAESDLHTSQLNYLNALLNVLSSKLDVMKARGTISIPTY